MQQEQTTHSWNYFCLGTAQKYEALQFWFLCSFQVMQGVILIRAFAIINFLQRFFTCAQQLQAMSVCACRSYNNGLLTQQVEPYSWESFCLDTAMLFIKIFSFDAGATLIAIHFQTDAELVIRARTYSFEKYSQNYIL